MVCIKASMAVPASEILLIWVAPRKWMWPQAIPITSRPPGGQVFVSINALAATVGPPSGVTFQNLAGLPGRTVTQVAFDPNDPNVIYATLSGVGGGHVFRTSIGASAWTDISPPIDIPFNALALDGVSVP